MLSRRATVSVLEALTSIATIGAVLAALWQLGLVVMDGRARDEDRRVERALALCADVVAEGATHEGFHRFSILLRRLGSKTHGATTWHVVRDADLEVGGELDPQRGDREQAFADLYAVLWFFERCEVSLNRKIVSEDVLMQTVGFHFWWWGQVLFELHAPKATVSVHALAVRAEQWAKSQHHLDDWKRRTEFDFDGGTAKDLALSRRAV
jgi:hypothetical protein